MFQNKQQTIDNEVIEIKLQILALRILQQDVNISNEVLMKYTNRTSLKFEQLRPPGQIYRRCHGN